MKLGSTHVPAKNMATRSVFIGSKTYPSSNRLLLLACFVCILSLAKGQGDDPDKIMEFTVVEEDPPGTPVGTVSTSDIILFNIPESERSLVQYSWDAKDVKHQNLFRIDQKTGDIVVHDAVDREVVCPRATDCILLFTAFANKDDFFGRIPVAINVTDINDNPPVFLTQSVPPGLPFVFEVRFPESSLEGSTRALLTATDADMSGAFGAIRYSLEPASSVFALDVSQSNQQVNLRLLTTLDRETTASYNLRLIATDGGDPPKNGTLPIRVLVEDFNDNNPRFTQRVYTANFSETEGAGYEIVKVHATDRDEGKNGRVVYDLSPQQPSGSLESIVDKVVVNADTGSVTLSQPLSSGAYVIVVVAQDMGDSFLSDRAEIRVTVLDTDNNEPTVRLNAVPAGGDLPEGWVSESQKVGHVVGFLTVDDPDSGNNGNVTCFSLEPHFKLELSGGGVYKLVLAQQLDYETAHVHSVEAVCKDQGTPSLNASATLQVNVADENDNSPKFTKDIYVQGIFENNVVQETVVIVTAMDRDSEERGRVRYQLLPDAGSNFTISPANGVIRTTIRFDREAKDVYEFTVMAVDNGNPSLNSTARVKINIRDKNDVAPVFGRPKYKFHLYENRDADSVVGNITVSDPDLNEGGKITLSLVFDKLETETVYGSDNVNNGPFSISADGKIFSRKVFDREEKPSYSFYVVATDQGQRKLSSSVEAVVEILDMNDHRPTFSFPSEHNFSALASIPIQADQSVLKVEVNDMDAGKNSIISYSIVSTNASSGLFRIGKFSGEIVASRDIGRADLGTFFITVNASDQGSPSLWENRTLNLIIQAAAAHSDDQVIADQNVLIVVCIVCFTVIVSGGIFIALCVLRRLDRQKKLQYTGACCHSNRSDLDSGSNEDAGPQQYDLAPPIAKETSNKGNSVSSPYHQFINQPGYSHQKNFSTSEGAEGSTQAQGMFSRPPHTGFDPTKGGRAVPTAPPRQEDHHSTSSTETAAGDSGHGSDEEFSNSLDQSSVPVPLPSGSAAAAATGKPSMSSFALPNAGSSSDKTSRSMYPHNSSYHSMSSFGKGAQFHKPGSTSSLRGSSRAFPFTDKASLSSPLSKTEASQFSSPPQQQFPMAALPPQRRKNSSVRFHPLVTDIPDQSGQGHIIGKTQMPVSNRSAPSSNGSSVSGYSSGKPSAPPPPPPSRQPIHQQQPRYQNQHQHPPPPQSMNPLHSSLLPSAQPYPPKQHSLLAPLSISSTSSSPLDISEVKRNMRLSSSLGSGTKIRQQLSPLSPLSRTLGHEPTEESDLNTTTSGSYSVASDDVESRLNDFGETADAYV